MSLDGNFQQNCINYQFHPLFFFSPTRPHWPELVIESSCPCVCLCVCAIGCSFFLGLSLALRSHDQIPASHWSTLASLQSVVLASISVGLDVTRVMVNWTVMPWISKFITISSNEEWVSYRTILSWINNLTTCYSNKEQVQYKKETLSYIQILWTICFVENIYVPSGPPPFYNIQEKVCHMQLLTLQQ